MVSYVYLWGTVVCVKYKAVVKLSMIEFGGPNEMKLCNKTLYNDL